MPAQRRYVELGHGQLHVRDAQPVNSGGRLSLFPSRANILQLRKR